MNLASKIIAFSSLLYLVNCTYPEDRKDNPNNEPVTHTGNAMETVPLDTDTSSVLTAADSARMVFNDDSSVSGTPSGRGTEMKGEAVGTGTSKSGENVHRSRQTTDSTSRN